MAGGGSGGGILRELLAVFSFGVETGELKKGEDKLGEFFEHVKGLAEGLAGLFAIHEIVEFAESNVRAMTAIEHASARLGIATERVQLYQFAAKSLGMEGETLLNMLGRLQITQQAAGTGNAEAAKTFHDLGVNVKDTNGHFKDADALFLDVADKIAETKDASKQAALATKLFGRSGRELLPLLKEGREGVEGLAEEFKALGGGYTEEAIAKSKKFEEQSAKLNLAILSLKGNISSALLPILTKLEKGVTKVVNWFREMTAQSDIVQAALLVLGVAAGHFAVQMMIAFAPILLMAAAIAGLILIVDSFLVMMEGGQSVIGDAIDKIFGKDAHLETVKELKFLWESIKVAIELAGTAVSGLYHDIKKIIDALGSVGGWVGDTIARAVNAKQEFDERHSAGEYRRLHGIAEPTKTPERRARDAAIMDIGRAALTGESLPVGVSMPPMLENGGAPRVAARPPAPAGGREGDVTTNIHVEVHTPPGFNGKDAAPHIANEVHKVLKADRRAAAAGFQRVNPDSK